MESNSLTKLCKWGAISLGVLIVLSIVFPIFDDVPVQILLHLLSGGFAQAAASLPYMIPSGRALVGFAALVILSLCALQILLSKFAKSKQEPGFRWRPKWTLSMVCLVLAAIGTACATVGLAHHATWLLKDGVTYFDDGRSPTIRSISNCRQLITALRIYASDHGGDYPKVLEDLVLEGVLSQYEFAKINRMMGRDGLPAPLIFLPGLTDAASGDIPLIIGSSPADKNCYILGHNDSSVSAVRKEEFDEAMARYWKIVGVEGQSEVQPASQQNRGLTPPASVP